MDSLKDEFVYHDMPYATELADQFEEGIKAYGFSAEQILRYQDSDFTTMYLRVDEQYDKIKESAQ